MHELHTKKNLFIHLTRSHSSLIAKTHVALGTQSLDEVEQKAPRNWIPERRWRKYKNFSEISPQNTEILEATHRGAKLGEILPKQPEKYMEPSIVNTGREILHNNYRIRSNITVPKRKKASIQIS